MCTCRYSKTQSRTRRKKENIWPHTKANRHINHILHDIEMESEGVFGKGWKECDNKQWNKYTKKHTRFYWARRLRVVPIPVVLVEHFPAPKEEGNPLTQFDWVQNDELRIILLGVKVCNIDESLVLSMDWEQPEQARKPRGGSFQLIDRLIRGSNKFQTSFPKRSSIIDRIPNLPFSRAFSGPRSRSWEVAERTACSSSGSLQSYSE